MKVIFLKSVKGVGQPSDVKVVSDGYASNFLLPQKLAEVASEEKLKALASKKEADEKEIKEREAQMDAAIESLRDKRIQITSKATEKGGLFKSVGTKDIADAIKKDLSATIATESILLKQPIKTLGEHTVELRHRDRSAKLTLEVVSVS